VIVNQAPGYRLVLRDGELDAGRFQTLGQQGHGLLQRGEAARAADVLSDALRLWRGEVLADFADAPFVQAERSRLADLRLTVLEDRLGADLAIGRHALITSELEQLTAEHPFREHLQSLRMTALYRCGRQAERCRATSASARCCARNSGLDPSPALRDLEGDILRQAAHLDWTAATGVDAGASDPAVGGAPQAPTAVAVGPDLPPRASVDLAGRAAHLRAIEEAVAATAAGRGGVVLVAGEPGIGKTRLATEAADRARACGVTVAWGRSGQDTGAPAFWPWTQVIRQLSTEVSPGPPAAALGPHAAELAVVLPSWSTANRARRRRCSTWKPHASVCARRPRGVGTPGQGRRLLIVLDDLHWADVASQRLLAHVGATLADAPIVVLATYRDQPLDGGESLDETLAALARTSPLDRLKLAGLGPADVARVMASYSDSAPDDELVRLILDRTGGNPFFVHEVLRLLTAHGWQRRARDEAALLVAEHVPAGVRDVLRQRLSRLPDQTRTVLLVAAAIGEEFDLDVIRDVAGIEDDDALDAVELTVSAGLVVEDPVRVGRFRFAHALIREAIYGETSRARRARLHARVAHALLDRRGEDPEHVLQVAHHWWLAAPVAGADAAIPHVLAAADRCLATLAHEEAERQLSRSLDLLAVTPPSAGRSAGELAIQLRLGTLQIQLWGTGTERAWASFSRARELAEELGDHSAALAACRSLYEVAFARADHRTAGDLARVMLGMARHSDDPAVLLVSQLALGRTLWSQGRLGAAREHLEHGLQVAGQVDETGELLPPSVTLQLQLAAVLYALDESDAGADLLTAAVRSSRGSPFELTVSVTGAALVAALGRDVPAARAWATEALDLADRYRTPTPGGYAAVVLSWLEALDGAPGDAIAGLRRHLDQIEAGGAQHLVAWGLGLLAEAHLLQDQPAEALRLLDDALDRVERTGERLYESELHRLRALSLLALDPPRAEQARSALRRAVTTAGEQGAESLRRRAVDTCRAAGIDPHSGSRSQPDPEL
jgi:tetratricopeptide (TPR) repeat protein